MFFLLLRENIMIPLRLLVQEWPLCQITRYSILFVLLCYDAFTTHANSSTSSPVLVDSDIRIYTANHAPYSH